MAHVLVVIVATVTISVAGGFRTGWFSRSCAAVAVSSITEGWAGLGHSVLGVLLAVLALGCFIWSEEWEWET